MSELVSIVLPCYNQSKYVSASIESVLKQSYENFELIIIDNASTDGTKEIIQEYAKEFPKIKAIYHEKNVGFQNSINEGFETATGDFIAIQNSDDIWYPNKLQEQVETFRKNPEVDIISSDADIIDENGNKTEKKLSEEIKWNESGIIKTPFKKLSKVNFCCHPSLIFRKNCFETEKGYDPSLGYACDWWFLLSIVARHKLFYIGKPLLSYRVHSGNLTKDKSNTYKDMIEVRKRLAEHEIDIGNNYALAGVYTSLLGDDYTARKYALDAEKYGKLRIPEKIATTMILKLKKAGPALKKMNELRHLLNF